MVWLVHQWLKPNCKAVEWLITVVPCCREGQKTALASADVQLRSRGPHRCWQSALNKQPVIPSKAGMRDGALLFTVKDSIFPFFCAAGALVVPCNVAWGSARRRAGDWAAFPSSRPRLLALPNQTLSCAAPILIWGAVWVVVVFPGRLWASLNCQTKFFFLGG